MLSTGTLDVTIQTSKDVLFEELDGEAVLLNIDTGVYLGLNATGTRIWQLLAAGRTLREILALMLDEYETDEQACSKDILDLVQQLKANGLIEIK